MRTTARMWFVGLFGVLVLSLMTADAVAGEKVFLKPEHAPALVGSWAGPYLIIDPGWRGTGTMVITSAEVGSVEAYFEYRWRGANYDRSPKGDATFTGKIRPDGTLQIGDGSEAWELTLEQSGSEYTFTAKERLGPGMTKFNWSRSGMTLE